MNKNLQNLKNVTTQMIKFALANESQDLMKSEQYIKLVKRLIDAAVDLTFDSEEEVSHPEEPLPVVDKDGTQRWYNEAGQLHRDNDQPAVTYSDGAKYWWKNGELHRDNGPAVIRSDGTKKWYKNGKFIKEEKI